MMNLGGAMTAMITPFRDGKVDESRLREQIEFQIGQGIDGWCRSARPVSRLRWTFPSMSG